MEYKKQYIPPSPQKRPQIKLLYPKYLTIHSNESEQGTAQKEHDFLVKKGNNKMFSFHIVVDDTMAIECVPLTEVAWHAGDGRGDGNMKSLSILICQAKDKKKAWRNAAILAAQILVAKNWSIEQIVQHYYWNRKDCPSILREENKWELWLDEVVKEMACLLYTSRCV